MFCFARCAALLKIKNSLLSSTGLSLKSQEKDLQYVFYCSVPHSFAIACVSFIFHKERHTITNTMCKQIKFLKAKRNKKNINKNHTPQYYEMVSVVIPWPTYILFVIPGMDSEVMKICDFLFFFLT